MQYPCFFSRHVCIYVLHVYVYVYVYDCLCTCICVYVYVYMIVYVHVYVYMYGCMCIFYMHVHVHVYMYIYMFICICLCPCLNDLNVPSVILYKQQVNLSSLQDQATSPLEIPNFFHMVRALAIGRDGMGTEKIRSLRGFMGYPCSKCESTKKIEII